MESGLLSGFLFRAGGFFHSAVGEFAGAGALSGGEQHAAAGTAAAATGAAIRHAKTGILGDPDAAGGILPGEAAGTAQAHAVKERTFTGGLRRAGADGHQQGSKLEESCFGIVDTVVQVGGGGKKCLLGGAN